LTGLSRPIIKACRRYSVGRARQSDSAKGVLPTGLSSLENKKIQPDDKACYTRALGGHRVILLCKPLARHRKKTLALDT